MRMLRIGCPLRSCISSLRAIVLVSTLSFSGVAGMPEEVLETTMETIDFLLFLPPPPASLSPTLSRRSLVGLSSYESHRERRSKIDDLRTRSGVVSTPGDSSRELSRLITEDSRDAFSLGAVGRL